MSVVGKDPAWRVAERLVERHARAVLHRVDVRAATGEDASGVDVAGETFAAMVERRRSPVDRPAVERLQHAAGARTAALYSRSGFTKTAVLWADERSVALFGYTDTGFVAPLNRAARDLVQRAQLEAEHKVRTANDVVARYARRLQLDAEARDREARAAALRVEQEEERAAARRRTARERRETVLGRTVVLLLQIRLDPDALALTVRRLTDTTLVAAVADEAPRLSDADRRHAVALLRTLFHDAAAAFEVLTPTDERGTAHFRAGARALERGLDALDAADGVGSSGHVPPDDAARELREADLAWRSLTGELVKVAPVIKLPELPTPRMPQRVRPARPAG
jgi:hypothetical protein